MRNMYAQISPGRVEVEDYYREKKQESLEMLQIFWDNGKSFNEADSEISVQKRENSDGV